MAGGTVVGVMVGVMGREEGMAHGEATAEEEGEEAMEEGRRRTHQPDLTQQKSGGKAAMFMSCAGSGIGCRWKQYRERKWSDAQHVWRIMQVWGGVWRRALLPRRARGRAPLPTLLERHRRERGYLQGQ